MKKLKDFYKKFDVPTKKLYGDYHIEKKVFNFSLGLILFLFGIALLTAPPNSAYVKCDSYSGCENPFYNYCEQEAVDCKEKTVPYGEYGTKPDTNFLHEYFFLIVISIVGLAFLFNHLKYNRGVKN